MNALVNPKHCKIEGTGIHLEPRLQEYVTKKELYKKYNINPVVSLEEEFGITRDDKIKIKMIKKNGGQVFENNCQEVYNENISGASLSTNNLLDSQFTGGFLTDNVKDKKFTTLFKKQQKLQKKENNKKEQILNKQKLNDMNSIPGGGWLKENDNQIMDGRYFSQDFFNSQYEDTTFKNQVNQHSKQYESNTEYKSNTEIDNDFFNPYEIENESSTKHYNQPPKIKYNRRSHQEETLKSKSYNNDINNVIGTYDTYRNHVNPTYQKQSNIDPHILPVNNDYKSAAFMGFNKSNEYGENTEIMNGMPITRTRKSYGYENPFENQFQYISDDIQKPEHTVLPFPRGGYGTRQYNRETAK
jgi:hypothetical protein